MFSVAVTFEQPWFEPTYFLTQKEEDAFRCYFQILEDNISRLLSEEPELNETSLTAGLVQSISGVDSIAKHKLVQELRNSDMEVNIHAREFVSKSKVSGEMLDFLLELIVRCENNTLVHRCLLIEAKKLYPTYAGQFCPNSRFKELNKPEKDRKGKHRIRSVIQAKTMMECGSRSGVFVLYCPRKIDSTVVGVRILFPETTYLMPRQPTLRQTYRETLPLADFMIHHFFSGRRGFDYSNAKSIAVGDSKVGIRYHWTMELIFGAKRELQKDDMTR
jgi:hypothetical protein